MDEKQSDQANKQASQYLRVLAKRNARAYMALPNIRAIIVTGSSVEGVSDFYSDIDTILYYDELPSEEALQQAYQQNQGEGRRIFGERESGSFFESYKVHGVECQFAHPAMAKQTCQLSRRAGGSHGQALSDLFPCMGHPAILHRP